MRIRCCPVCSRWEAHRNLTCQVLDGGMSEGPPGLRVLQQPPYGIELILSEINGGAGSFVHEAAKIISPPNPPKPMLSRNDASIARQVHWHGDKRWARSPLEEPHDKGVSHPKRLPAATPGSMSMGVILRLYRARQSHAWQ